MKNKMAILMVSILLISLISAGCVDNGDLGTDTREVTDILDRDVTVPMDIDRIVGVASGAVRMITYLEATDMIVGVEEFEKRRQFSPYQHANPELSEHPSIGPQHGGDAELILEQEPDVIFYSCSQVDPALEEDMNDLQRKTNIPVIGIDLGDLNERKDVFQSSLRLMGEVLDKEEKAEEVITYIDETLEDLDELTQNISDSERPSVYVGGVALRGSHDITSTRLSYPPFEYTNSINVASELGDGHEMIDKEQLIEWDPDIIFIDTASYDKVMEDLTEDDAYQELKAVQEENIFTVLPYNRYNINHGTVLANAYYVGSVLYPEQFSDINPEKKADDIYEFMVGGPAYEQMEEKLGGFYQLELSD